MSILIRGGLVLAHAEAQPTAADILIEGAHIARVGPNLEPGPGATILDARDRLAIPGLVNAHTHGHSHLVRGVVDRLPLQIWVHYLAAHLMNRTPREVYVGAAIGAIEMAKTGTTCACDMAMLAPWPTDETLDALARAYADVGLRASIAAQACDLPFFTSMAGLDRLLPEDLRAELGSRPPYPRAEVLATIRRAVERWHGAANGRLRWSVGPALPSLCTDEFLEACGALVREHDLTLQTHLSEIKAEASAAWLQHGKSATARLHELGLLEPRAVLAHGVWLDDDEIDLIAESGSTVAHNPYSNLKLGSGLAPLLRMRERGCNVALGTDGSACSDNQNMFGPLRLAAILHRVVDPDFERWPSAAEALRMATLNGARAAGFEGEIGALTPGSKADLVLLDLGSSYYHPRNDLVSQLVHCEVGSSVTTVLVDGRVIVEQGRVVTVDEAALLAEADEIGQRIAAEAEGRASFARRLEPYVRQAYFAACRADWPINRFASEAWRG